MICERCSSVSAITGLMGTTSQNVQTVPIANTFHEDIKVFGGGTVRASRAEIDRVRHQLALSKHTLISEGASLGPDLLAQLQLALELPAFMHRFEAIETACLHAAERYFGAESAIAQRIHRFGQLDVPRLATGLAVSAGSIGLLKESAIAISRTGFAGGISAPSSVAELAERLKRTSTDGDLGHQAEFRIERFGNHVIVYIPGTKRWSPVAGSNPLDLTSNVHAMASQSQADGHSKAGDSTASSLTASERAASERAVLAALRSAKVGRGDEVILVGHSQGGIVAANIASTRHEFKVSGIVTFGSPIALAEVASDTRVLALEHTNDPVPTLDSEPNPQRENWVTVKESYPLARGESPIAVHDLKGYLKLASEVDANRSVRLKSVLDYFKGFAGHEPGRVEWFTAQRI